MIEVDEDDKGCCIQGSYGVGKTGKSLEIRILSGNSGKQCKCLEKDWKVVQMFGKRLESSANVRKKSGFSRLDFQRKKKHPWGTTI